MILDRFSLHGKVALVTGGYGMFGRQIVAALAEAGAKVHIASRSLDALKSLADERQARGENVVAAELDLCDEASILRLRDTIVADGEGLDILVNNAVLRSMKKGYRDDASTFAESMQANATGLFIITRALGDVIADSGGGSIINVCSIQGMVGPDPTIYEGTEMNGFYPDYFFHKGGMINFTRFTASYYGPKGVRCNCISPGGFQTEKHPEIFVKQYSARTMLGRMADSTDLMGAIVFLASDTSAYITGTNIPVDGGYTAK